MLGDVYSEGADRTAPRADSAAAAGSGADLPRPSRRAALPDWADEGVLDVAFADWVPGPPTSAPAAERSMLTDLAGGMEGSPTKAPPTVAPAVVVVAPSSPVAAKPVTSAPSLPASARNDLATVRAPGEPAAWRREDDDIVPARSRVPKTSFRMR